MSLAKKIFLGMCTSLLLVISSGIIIAVFYEDVVKNYVISEINKQLNTEIDVQTIDFSVLKKFPYASLEFSKVTALDAYSASKSKDTLLSVENLFLQFNILDIINERYQIKKIELNQGFSKIKIFENGKDNFHFWKTSDDSSKSQFSFALKELVLRNFNISFSNKQLNHDIGIDINYTILSGNFSTEEFDLAIETKIMAQHVSLNNTLYLKNQLVKLNTVLYVSSPNHTFKVKKGEVSISDLNFGITGNINTHDNTKLDLLFDGKDLNIQSFFSLLPKNITKSLTKYESKGKFYFTSSIKGIISQKENPSVIAEFGVTNGEILQNKTSSKLENVFLKGKYSNGSKRNPETTTVEIESFSFKMGTGKITGDIKIEDFNNPHIIISTIADLQLAELKAFINNDSIETLNGKIKLDASFNGKIKNFNNYTIDDFKKSKTSGSLKIIEINLKLKENPLSYSGLNGNFLFDNNDIIITEFTGNILNNHFNLNGFFRNVISYFFIEGQKLVVDANLKSNQIVLDELLVSSTNSSDTSYNFAFSKNANFYLTLDVGKFNFKKFEAAGLKGKIILKNEKFLADGLTFNAFEGDVNITGYIDGTDHDNILISCDAGFNKVNINKLFYQFDNFGQTTLLDKNLKGIATSSIQFISVIDSKLDFKTDKLYTKADLKIEKGELINFEPIKNLSSFISLEELEHIKFSYLHNEIEIRNQKVIIPKTEIVSSALNLTFSGSHSFKDEIDYRIKVLLSDLLAQKARKKKENEEFGFIQNEDKRKMALFIKVSGTLDKPKFSYDKIGLTEKIKEDIGNEKKSLKSLLKDEFGLYKNDSTVKVPEKNIKQVNLAFEWEEESKPENIQQSKPTNLFDKKQKTKFDKLIDKIAGPENKNEYIDGSKFE